MMRREEFLRQHPNITGEMTAYSVDGEKLGRITTLDQDTINIEKGFFFPRDFVVPYDDIVDVHGGEMVIGQHGAALSRWREEAQGGRSTAWELGRGEEIDIPLREEELHAQKIERRKGEVHLRKVVHTEQRTITIPVTVEDVVIEHKPAGAGGEEELQAGQEAFQEQEFNIPIMEEDVELVKNLRVRESVHARKVAHTEQRELSGEVRVEDVEVEKEGGPAGETEEES